MRLFGKNPIFERLRSQPSTIRRIYLQEGFAEASYVHQKAKKWGIPILAVPKTKLIKMARNHNIQGIVAETDEFIYQPFDELLEKALEKQKCLLFLDNITDPQNLGAILRTMACLGGFSVILPTHDSVEVTESVLRVACGGENYVPISKVSNLNNAIKTAKDNGFSIAGTFAKEGESLINVKFTFPLGLVLGSEEKGVRDIIRKQLDFALTIPMANQSLSLNVAHAAAILGYEILRQRQHR